MKRLPILLLIFISLCSSVFADSADSDNERARLAGIAKELALVERLTYESEAKAESSARVKFNYDALRRDINLMRAGIEEHVQAPRTEPRKVEPLVGDYRK